VASRAGLDRAACGRAAARLADEAGGQEVTLAELLAILGVRTPSLYNHIAGEEGLRRELALLGRRELETRLSQGAIGKAKDDAILAMAHAIQPHELLYRLDLVAHLVVTVTNVPLAVIFYELFTVVNRRLALLDAFFILVATAIEAAGLLNQFTPLVLLGSGPSTSALPAAQLQALAYMPNVLSEIAYSIHTVFFGVDIICFAYLVLRSTFLPRAVGVLLAIDGLAYLVYSFADLLAPGFAAHLVPWIQLPALFGEGSLCLVLLVVDVDVERWNERASAAIRMRSTEIGALA
jgi:hypothetical protein